MIQLYRNILSFFPISLLIIHFKRNHLLLLFWIILFAIITQKIGSFYGIHYLFLAPEYLGKVNYLSFAIVGLTIGSFIVAFNIYSYRLNILVFPFMATVSKPFIKYTYNNCIIPLAFIATYIYESFLFQTTEEFISTPDAILNTIGFLSGILFFILLAYLYFLRFDQNIYTISGLTEEELAVYRTSYDKKINGLKESSKWERRLKRIGPWRVNSYLIKPFKIGIARSSDHYNRQLVKLFFTKNHVNASFFELGVIFTFVLLGLIKNSDYFMLPAGASILILCSLILMLINTFYSFFRHWSMTVIILCIVGLNLFSKQMSFLSYKSYAYGITYTNKKTSYDEATVNRLATDEKQYKKDLSNAIQTLENWKKRTGKEKPKLIVLNTSGGGSRSALWTYSTLTYLDSMFSMQITNQLQFISGASGGMIGATYFRENYLNSKIQGNNSYMDKIHLDNLSKDILNSIAYSTATSDFLPRFSSFKDGEYTYPVDRGYIFEKKLNQNLNHAFEKRLSDYKQEVFDGIIPMMVYAPTILTENRRLLICTQPISYLCYKDKNDLLTSENIEFTRLFKNHTPYNLRISSAVRMSATFPFILPISHLPSVPEIKLMDAGGRDNQGKKVTYRYLFELREWINANTSGVIIINIRDTENKIKESAKEDDFSIQKNLLSPISLPYHNFFGVQDFVNDEIYGYLSPYFNQIDQVNFCLSSDKKVSLNFHLTKKDKQLILNEINSPDNQLSVKKLNQLLQ